MNPMRLYWVVKGEQDVKIGDNINEMLAGDIDDYYVLDWETNFKDMFRDIARDIESFERIVACGGRAINSNLYICSASGTIRGIMSINKNKAEVF